jgi:regulator of sigma E protease
MNIDFNNVFANIGAFLMMAAGFCFVIFVHELGHFLAAKAVNIKVTQFALGFGTAIFSWRKGIGLRAGSTEKEYKARLEANPNDTSLGETEYRFNWVPLGGYVKMVGQEDLNPEATSADPRSFSAASGWARTVVLSAGVVMNIIFGLLFFIIAFMAGVALPPALIGQVALDQPAGKTYAVGHENDDAFRGIRPGDQITQINGAPITDFTELAIRTALTAKGEPIVLTVSRDGQPAPLTYSIIPEVSPQTGLLSIGVGPSLSTRVVDDGMRPLVLEQAGVESGMVASAVNGNPITRFDQIETAAEAAQGRPIEVTFSTVKDAAHPDKPQKTATASIAAVPELDHTSDGVVNIAGLVPATLVGNVMPKMAATEAGVKPGDLIARIDSMQWPRIDTVQPLVQKGIGRKIDFVALRNGAPESFSVTPSPEGKLGILMEVAYQTNIVGEVLHDSPLAPLALNYGSRINAINGEKVTCLADIQRALAAAVPPGFKIIVPDKTLEGDAKKKADEAAAVPVMTAVIEYQRNIVGYPIGQSPVTFNAGQVSAVLSTKWTLPPIVFGSFEMLNTPLCADSPWQATKLGFLKTQQFTMQTYVTIARLFQGTVGVKDLRGPVGIAHEGTRIARRGWTYLFFFLGLISVNLAVMNFLPFPVLDGGQIVLLIIEKVKGSPVSIKQQEVATYIALAALLCLVLVTTVLDVTRLFKP